MTEILIHSMAVIIANTVAIIFAKHVCKDFALHVLADIIGMERAAAFLFAETDLWSTMRSVMMEFLTKTTAATSVGFLAKQSALSAISESVISANLRVGNWDYLKEDAFRYLMMAWLF